MVKRLLKPGLLLFLGAMLLAPLLECFDTWDVPGQGPWSDTEMSVAALGLLLGLVLLLCLLIRLKGFMAGLRWVLGLVEPDHPRRHARSLCYYGILIPPRLLPLQI